MVKALEYKRSKGFMRYVFIQTLVIGGALIAGKLISVALFTNQSQWGRFSLVFPRL